MLICKLYKYEPSGNEKPIAFYSGGVVFDKLPSFAINHDNPLEDGMTYSDAYEIGYYEDGAIFKYQPMWGVEPIGYYDSNKIYNKSLDQRMPIGYYMDGKIYKILPESGGSPIGYYEGQDDGAAASAFLIGLLD